ncbi:DNA-binding protein [Paenibacillus elgii]
MDLNPDVSWSESEAGLSHYFSVAEHLFHAGKKTEAVPLYRYVIENEQDVQNQQYILSQFRLFQALIGIGSEENKEALLRFESHYTYLPDDIKLDALLQMANVYYTMGNWEKVESYADELRVLAKSIYDKHIEDKTKYPSLQTKRPLVVYYGQGYLLKGIALTMQDRCEEAKGYVLEYSDLGWFEFLDEVGRKEVEKFRIWGKANMYSLELKTGNQTIIPEYLNYLEENPNELLPGALNLVESANKYGFSVDTILDDLCQKISIMDSSITSITGTQLFHFWYEKASYSFKKVQMVNGINDLLQALYIAQKIRYYSGFERCISLFSKQIQYASEQQKANYRNLLEGVSEL